ncbi:helix-turn-helix domain-containing protein [Enterocloster citroniae]
MIQKALQRFTGPYGKQAAADALGISKATLYRKIQEYRLDGA